MKIIKITNLYPKAIQIDFEEGEWAKLYEFGWTIVSITSDRIKKSTLLNLKKDAKLCEWDASKLENLYINDKCN